MPQMTPVADQIIPPNPQAQLQTYSGLLGLQQQKIGIQQQEQQLTAQTAEAQQAQQKNQELQQAQQLALSVKNGAFRNKDGSVDQVGLSQAVSQVGPYAASYANQLVSQANEIVANQRAINDLTQSQRTQIGEAWRGLAGKSDLNMSDVINTADQLLQSNPQLGRQLLSAMAHLPQNASPEQLRNVLSQWGASFTGQSQVAPTTINTGGKIIPGSQNLQTGEFSPGGQSIALPPQQVVGPNGQILNRDPQSGALSVPGGAPGAPGAPASTPASTTAPATAANDPERPGANAPGWEQQAFGQMVQKTQGQIAEVQHMDAGYQTNMSTADMIRKLSSDVNSGPGTQGWTRFLGGLGSRIPYFANNVATTQTLGSFLDLQSARLRESMGLPATNAGLATSQEMGTSIESQREAIQAKTDYYQALTQLQHYYRMGLDAAGNKGVNPSPTSVNKFKGWFTKNADPLAVEIQLAHQRGDTAAIGQILKGLSPQQRNEIADHGRALDQYFAGQQ